jgi:hypothetical protein
MAVDAIPPGGRLNCCCRFLLALFLLFVFVGGAPAPENLRTAHSWRLVDVDVYGGVSLLFALL